MIPSPSEIAIAELPFRTLKLRRQLPKLPCVYFVLGENACVLYIGKSICLHKRWKKHAYMRRVKEIPEARIAWILLSDAQFLEAAEAVLIAHFRPPWNARPPSPEIVRRLLQRAWDPGNTEGDEHY
jgi:excinuclease UvrABC nuclease subunit